LDSLPFPFVVAFVLIALVGVIGLVELWESGDFDEWRH
jgi:hypothetical protein